MTMGEFGMPPRIVAELRDWTWIKTERPSFQGKVFNDITNRYRDGHFLTIDAHDVAECAEGLLVTHTEGHIYTLWYSFQRIKK